ncbi:MAG: DUF4178 domain-containing protein [Proteobacteria bacterium]|nr:MAG: DUF4178 domain-containing protein [Pseudomonadota bacterium]
MQKLSCPGCGAELTLQSSATVYLVCPYCKNTVIHDRDWKSFGLMADLPLEVTPLQIGSQGLYADEGFELIGRQRIRWENGYWTEWAALFPKGRIGFLSEAQGHWMMSFPVPLAKPIADAKLLWAGKTFSIDKTGTFRVVDAKRARCIGIEGELPFTPKLNEEILYLDSTDDNNRFMGVEIIEATGEHRAFLGKYVDFKDFKFKNLRKLDGW